MPTYEYACRDCGEHLEVVQSFKDDALTTCPNCEGNLRKVFSAAGIIFKGSGWHIKDYKDAGKAPSTSSSPAKEKDKDGGGSSDATSSESSTSSTSSDSSSTSGGDAKSA